MTFHIDRISSTVVSHPDSSLLSRAIEDFDSGQVLGVATLAETPLLKHLRLLFFGTDKNAETVLCGPASSPLLLEFPTLADQLLEITGDFLNQVRRLDTPTELRISQEETTYSGLIDTASNECTLSA